jgi:WD40 repeat protein
MPPRDSVVLIAGRDAGRRDFGTGFVVHRDSRSTWIVTCAHVIDDVGGPEQLLADSLPAEIVALSSNREEGFDVAVLRVDGELGKEPILLRTAVLPESKLTIPGYYSFDRYGKRVCEEIGGRLDKAIEVTANKGRDKATAWHLKLGDGDLLRPGYSGSPVIDSASGTCIGVVSHLIDGGARGLAVSVAVLERIWPGMPADLLKPAAPAPLPPPAPSPLRQDWGEAPDTSAFIGRTAELATLEKWIVEDRCRVVSIVGLGGTGKSALVARLGRSGIGKTDLSVKLAQGIQSDFTRVIWRRLLNAPPLSQLLSDLLGFLSDQQETGPSIDTGQQISRLLQVLRERRCLIILDNFESVLQGGTSPLLYRPGYEGYGELLRQMAANAHQSCLLLTSRELPPDVIWGQGRPARSLQLGGLALDEGRQIFAQIDSFAGSEKDWRRLIDFYNGNPLALELAARHIAQVYFGDIAAFLAEGRQVFETLNQLLDWHFKRLSDEEKDVLYWLAIEREPISLTELREDILDPGRKANLASTLQSLQSRLPLERSRTAGSFTLQPVLIEYVTCELIDIVEQELQLGFPGLPGYLRARLVEEASREIAAGPIGLLDRHALLKAMAKDYVRESQCRLIFQPIIERVFSALGSREKLVARLTELLAQVRGDGHLRGGYLAGNVVNLLCQMTVDLRGRDLSHLVLRQVYLQGVELQEVDFSGSTFVKCSFTQTFGSILTVAFSPDSRLLAAGDGDGSVHVWRLSDLQPLMARRGHANFVQAVAFSPDGQTLASGAEDRTIQLWDPQSGRLLAVLQKDSMVNDGVPCSRVWALAYSPDGRRLASGGDDCCPRIWDPAALRCEKTLQGHARRIRALAWSPDGRRLMSGSEDATVKVWDVETGACLATLAGHTDYIWGTALLADGRRLVSGGKDKTVRIWDLESGSLLQTLHGHTHWIEWVAASPDGATLASASDDNTVRIWDARDGSPVKALLGHCDPVYSVAYSPDGRQLASGSYDQTVRVYSTEDWNGLHTLRGRSVTVWWVAWSPDGRTVASASNDSVIRVWDRETGRLLRTVSGHDYTVQAVCFSPDSTRLVSGSGDQTVKVWDLRTGACLHTLQGHKDLVWAVDWSPDGRRLASGCYDRTVRIWDAATMDCLHTLPGHENWIWTVAWSPDSRQVASGSYDHTIRIWDAESGVCLQVLSGHTSSVQLVAWSPDGRRLVSGSETPERVMKIWDAASGECLQTLSGHENSIWSVAWSPDGRTLASGSGDRTVRLWDSASGVCLGVLEGHAAIVLSVAFAPDSRTLASGGVDEMIKLWDVATHACLKSLRPLRPYEGMDITGIAGLTAAQIETLKALGAVARAGSSG